MNAQSFPLSERVPVPAHWSGELASDLFASCGTPVLAVFDGIAEPIDVSLGGYTLFLTADDGTEAYMAHLQSNRTSGRVSAGQVIGYVSDSGNAKGTGCHIHFAVGKIDSNGAGTINPASWLAGAGSGGGGGGGDTDTPSTDGTDLSNQVQGLFASVPKPVLAIGVVVVLWLIISGDKG
jgi:hypothetical protein